MTVRSSSTMMARRALTTATVVLALHARPVRAQLDGVGAEVFRWVGVTVLVMFSGIFSGLTLGLLGLDVMTLDILIKGSESEQDRQNARQILKLRKDGNSLLCTLLFGNVVVNSALSIVSAEIFDGLIGLIVSTFVIVIFGEIIPQAVCHRYALTIGAKSVPLVSKLRLLFLPITAPIAAILNRMLGEDIGTLFTRGQMKAMFSAYVTQGEITEDEANVMTGAISYKDKCASDVMTPYDKVFHLKDTDQLDFATLSKVFKSGFSRLPVFSGHGNRWEDVQGMLLTKDLIMIDPEEAHNVMAAVQLFNRNVGRCYPDTKLSEVLKSFKAGTSHMSIVVDVNNKGDGDPFYELVGVVTMEDIIEEILQAEIVDETDVYVHMEEGDKIERDSFDFARLRLLDTSMTQTLSKSELSAVSVHLRANVGAFRDAPKLLTPENTMWLLQNSAVLDIKGENLKTPKILYRRDKIDTFFTLILSGKIQILAGRDEVRVEYGAFQCLGEHALMVNEGEYKPDFTAVVEEGVRCLRISRAMYERALKGGASADRTAMRRRLSSKEEKALSQTKGTLVQEPPVDVVVVEEEGDGTEKVEEVAVAPKAADA
jgi:metal transporter CNNM